MKNISFQDAKKCNALTKRTQRRCGNVAVRGNEKCRLHGGKSLSGVFAGGYKTGAFSKYMPKNLLKIFGEILEDGELLSLHQAVATVDLELCAELFPNLQTSDEKLKGKTWRRIHECLNLRRKIILAEAQRLRLHHEFVRIDRVLLLLSAVIGSVRQHVHDPLILQKVNHAIREFMTESVEVADCVI